MEKKQEHINIIYSGHDVEDGIIDVKSLASNLLSFANLVQRISTLITDDEAIIDIKIKATTKGSFDVSLIMETFGSWSSIKHLFVSEDYNAIKEIISILLGVAGAGAGIFKLYKHLKNKKPKALKENDNGSITIINEEDQEIIVAKNLLKVYQDIEVRNSIKEVIKDTLSKNGLSNISFKTSSCEESISKEDSQYFDIPLDENEDTIIENEIISIYSIASLTFKEDNKWTLHDGNTQIKATIIDKLFLQKIEDSEIAFAKYDKLKCRVLLKQNIKDKLVKNEYIILEILEHIQSYKQITMFK
jgi:hypothetical protein